MWENFFKKIKKHKQKPTFHAMMWVKFVSVYQRYFLRFMRFFLSEKTTNNKKLNKIIDSVIVVYKTLWYFAMGPYLPLFMCLWFSVQLLSWDTGSKFARGC